MGHGVVVAEILKERRQSGQPVPDACADQAPVARSFAKGFALRDDMRAGHKAEFFRALDAGEQHKIPDGILVGALRAGIADILEPLDLARHLRKAPEFGRGQKPGRAGDFEGCFGPNHRRSLVLINRIITY